MDRQLIWEVRRSDVDQWLTARAEAETPAPSDEPTAERTTQPSEDPSAERTSAPTEEPTDVETDQTIEPTETPTADTVASDIDGNNDDLARTGAGVLWLIASGVAAILLGAVTMMLRRKNAS